MKILEYAKAHPWTTGAIVIGGGLVFIMLSGWFTGGTVNSAAPLSANEESNNELALAQLTAGVANANIALQKESEKLAYDLGVKQIEGEVINTYNTGLQDVATRYLDNYGSIWTTALENPLDFSSSYASSIATGSEGTKSGGFGISIPGVIGFNIGGSKSKGSTEQKSNNSSSSSQSFVTPIIPDIEHVLKSYSSNALLGGSQVGNGNTPGSVESQI